MPDQNQWEKVFSNDKSNLKWPDEIVIRFISKHMNSNLSGKVLDLGCGSGRHTEILASKGYNVFACDISLKSIEISKKRLKINNLEADFREAASWKLPYESNFFDFVIAWGSIYYNTFELMVKSLNEINRVLKKDGVMLASIIAKNDYRQLSGETKDNKTYIGKENSLDHNGLTYCVIENKKELEELASKIFNEFSIGYYEMYFDLNPRICHWIVTARKM